MRRLKVNVKGKVLVFSDIHLPYSKPDTLKRIISAENPDLLVLLGDVVVDPRFDYRSIFTVPTVFVKGDEDVVDGDTDVLELIYPNFNVVLLHGHQFFKESSQRFFARLLKRVNPSIPPFLFCSFFRLLFPTHSFLILGHSHALVKFNSIKCVNAGTLTSLKNLYNDHGYVVIIPDKRVEIVKLKDWESV